MPKCFHYFTTLKKKFGNQTSLAASSILKHKDCSSYFKINRNFTFNRSLNIPKIARVNFKQRPCNVLQENLNLANVKNNLIYQPLMYTGFGLQKASILFKSFLHTRPLNFKLCLHIFYCYSEKQVIILCKLLFSFTCT